MAKKRKDDYGRLTLDVPDAARLLGIGRAAAYEGVRRGEIPHVRIGGRILIPRAALEEMLADVGQHPVVGDVEAEGPATIAAKGR
jgi:excisionase family DNA binding protein